MVKLVGIPTKWVNYWLCDSCILLLYNGDGTSKDNVRTFKVKVRSNRLGGIWMHADSSKCMIINILFCV